MKYVPTWPTPIEEEKPSPGPGPKYIPIFGVAFSLLLSGCAKLEFAKDALPVIADKVVDRAYRLTCGLPYRTEARFLARHDISRGTLLAWCGRVEPR